MADERDDEDAARAAPGIPGMTRNEAATIRGETPDEPAPEEDDGDPMAPFDAESGAIGVADDDTLGVDDQDDRERERGATET